MQEINQVDHSNVENISKMIISIGRQHSELIQMVKHVNLIFSNSLLTNELFCITCVPFVGVLVLTNQYFNIAFAVIFLILFNMTYSFLGQKVIDSANKFSEVIYNCDWTQFSTWNRKQLVLIMLMAQQPVGIKSGGFHYVDYRQLTQVSLRYKFMLFEIYEPSFLSFRSFLGATTLRCVSLKLLKTIN